MITKDSLQKKREDLLANRERALATVNAINGALEMISVLEKELAEKNAELPANVEKLPVEPTK